MNTTLFLFTLQCSKLFYVFQKMHSSIYDDALAQLHSNYQSLQENIINVAREQSRVIEMVSRIQLDLETYKETQNER